MVLELICWIFLGCIIGLFTGLAPGIHVNTIAAIAITMQFSNPLGASLMIASMSIVHCFADLIPSILLGAPKEENFLAALPGHKMLLKGKGLLAVRLAATGALATGIISLAFIPVFLLLILKGEKFFSTIIPFALVFVLGTMVFCEKEFEKKIWAIIIIALSGILGLIVLGGKIFVQEPLFACITGFFGAATIIESIRKKSVLPKQCRKKTKISGKDALEGGALGFLAGIITTILPATGSSQSAFILQKIFGKIGTKKFLVLIGGSSISNVIFGFAGLFAWEKTRNGSAAAIRGLIGLSQQNLVIIMIACAIALGFGFIATGIISKLFIEKIEKTNYKKINFAILSLLCALVMVLSNGFGIMAFITATSFGLIAVSKKSRRTNCMAFLMIPTLFFYLGLQ
jgi:putative membrane protein